jgi:hypothetical protein
MKADRTRAQNNRRATQVRRPPENEEVSLRISSEDAAKW